MNKFIRWPGLISFVVLMTLIIGGTYFFAGPLIKSGIEKAGTAMVGARVDVGSVKLGLHPASISLFDVAVTDADKPMQNLFEFDKSVASIDLLKLMMGQTIIDDLELQGLRFETPRRTSGAIPKKPKPRIEEPSFMEEQLKSIAEELPDPDEILAREPLMIDQRKKEWDALYAEKKDAWEKIRAGLPAGDKIKGYEQELKALTQGKIKSPQDFNDRTERLKALKKEIKADKATLSLAADEIKSSTAALQDSLTNLKNAPKEDWDRIRDKYSLDDGGLANIANLLFGGEFGSYTQKGLYWYRRAEPYINSYNKEAEEERVAHQRLAGRYVRFPEQNPMPDLLIRKAAISATIPKGDISIEIVDLTHQQNIINRPTRMTVKSTALKDIKSMEIDGIFDHRSEQGSDTIRFWLAEAKVGGLKISGDSSFPLEMTSALADIKGGATLAGGKLKGDVISEFTRVVFTGESDKSFANELLLAIKSIDAFNVETTLAGNFKDIDVSIRSDLDKRLKEAFKDRLEMKKQEFKEKLNAKLQERLAKYLGDETRIDIFAGSEGIGQQIGQLEKMLEQKLDDYKDEQKKELKNKAKDKLLKQLL